MTEKELDELERLEKEATPAPWEYAGIDENISGLGRFIDAAPRGPAMGQSREKAEIDAEFIPVMRNAAPELLAAAKRERIYREALERIFSYRKRTDNETDYETTLTLQVIAQDAFAPTELSEAISVDRQEEGDVEK